MDGRVAELAHAGPPPRLGAVEASGVPLEGFAQGARPGLLVERPLPPLRLRRPPRRRPIVSAGIARLAPAWKTWRPSLIDSSSTAFTAPVIGLMWWRNRSQVSTAVAVRCPPSAWRVGVGGEHRAGRWWWGGVAAGGALGAAYEGVGGALEGGPVEGDELVGDVGGGGGEELGDLEGDEGGGGVGGDGGDGGEGWRVGLVGGVVAGGDEAFDVAVGAEALGEAGPAAAGLEVVG